jgi:hypothetical protein
MVLGPGGVLTRARPGLKRLREYLQLEPVEYPTTRKSVPHFRNAPPTSMRPSRTPRSRQSWPVSAQVVSSKCSAIWILFVLQANPKAFFGYSDNTNRLIYLWNLGIIGFYGGSTMVYLARPGRLHPTTLESIRRALFERGEVQLSPAVEMTDENPSWQDPTALEVEMPMRPGPGWIWAGEQRSVTGPTWGRCLEIVDMHLRAGTHLLAPRVYAGASCCLRPLRRCPARSTSTGP